MTHTADDLAILADATARLTELAMYFAEQIERAHDERAVFALSDVQRALEDMAGDKLNNPQADIAITGSRPAQTDRSA